MRPKPVKLSATTTEQTVQLGPALRSMMLKNVGNNDVYLDFDNAIDENNSYVLEAGETITIEYDFVNLYYKGVGGSSTLHMIKIIQ